MIYTTSEAMRSIAASIREGKGRAGMSAAYLRWKADEAADRRTECLTDFVSPAVSGNNHDFFSEGPYWWPDPKNPGGPYIRRDGEVNPDRFEDHDRILGRICGDALMLTLAAYHLDERHYADTALEKIHAFFVNPETKMNPHLDYAQAIRGVCSGRGIGIIDVRRIFGTGAIKPTEKIDLIINLRKWEEGKAYDRMGEETNFEEIMGIYVPSLEVPIRPGRNLAVIIEVAAMNNRNKKMGYNAAKELSDKLYSSMLAQTGDQK